MNLRDHLSGVDPEIRTLILLVAEKAKEIHAGFDKGGSISNFKNIYGEEQLELDKWADEVFLKAFEECELVRSVASEEKEEVNEIKKAKGSWGVTIDPLDGSSCVKTNLAVGTIVGLFNEGDVLEQGDRMDAACFVLYGPMITLVYACKQWGAHEFVLGSKTNEFMLRHENIKIPDGTIFAPGGLAVKYTDKHKAFVDELEKQKYKVRYTGSMTADFNQILHYGGIYMYPALKEKPEGKLRLLFEANPLTLIAKEAGGAGSNGFKSIHKVKPEKLSQRTPFYVGSRNSVELAEKIVGGNA